MRSKRIPTVVTSIVLIFAVVLLAFSCSRTSDSAPAGGGHEHGEDGMAAHPDQGHSQEPSGSLRDGVRVVDVQARQFAFDPATIVVREGETVRLRVTSEDVPHGFGLDAYDIDRELPPNETRTIAFTAREPGTHHFHCSVYCGSGHGDMHGELVVLPEPPE